MSFIMPDEGELALLGVIRSNGLIDGRSLRLFQNNITPTSTSVTADFTEATFSGYAANTSTAFGAASTVANKAQCTDAAARVFTHNGGGTANTIYGYYYVGATEKLFWAERFAAPVSMSTVGDNISVQVTFKLNGV